MARLKRSAIIKKTDIPSNKGATPPWNSSHSKNKKSTNSNKYNSNHIAYEDNNYYVTDPFIDKIVICGNLPRLDAEELQQLNGKLYSEAMSKEEGYEPESPVTRIKTRDWQGVWKNKRIKKAYKNHFKITPPGSKEFVLVSFEPNKKDEEQVNLGQRYMRLEFNPQKMGEENVRWFIDWYNETLVHCKFEELISQRYCINMLHVAVDIVGIHISELIFGLKDKGKSSRWHSEDGLLETYYFNATPGEFAMEAYDKQAEIHSKPNFKAEHDRLPYGADVPVTRVELTVATEVPLTKLAKLNNKFKDIQIHRLNPAGLHPRMKKKIDALGSHLPLFLDSVRFRGRKHALSKIPEAQKLGGAVLLDYATENVLECYYNNAKFWQSHWARGLKRSGLL